DGFRRGAGGRVVCRPAITDHQIYQEHPDYRGRLHLCTWLPVLLDRRDAIPLSHPVVRATSTFTCQQHQDTPPHTHDQHTATLAAQTTHPPRTHPLIHTPPP